MTVSELIEELRKAPPDAIVYMAVASGYDPDTTSVLLTEVVINGDVVYLED